MALCRGDIYQWRASLNFLLTNSEAEPDKELALFGGGGLSLTPEQFDTQRFSILFNKVDLELDSVFLKRLHDTLRLHKKFSKDSNESSAVVARRIGGAGIRVMHRSKLSWPRLTFVLGCPTYLYP